MSERLNFFIESTDTTDQSLDSHITGINLYNFDRQAADNGEFTGDNDPMVEILISAYENYPTGFTFSWDFAYDNYPELCVVDMYYDGGGHVRYNFSPTTPQMSDTWDDWEIGPCVERITCTVRYAHLGNQKLRFGGFHFGTNAIDLATTVTSCKIIQSCDLTGLTAAYSTLEATMTGHTIDQLITSGQKVKVATNLKDIGYFYTTGVTTTKRSANGINSYGITAVSLLGVVAGETYKGHYHTPMGAHTSADLFQTIVNGIAQDRFSIATPQTITDVRHNGYCFPNIPQGVDCRTALANIALACDCWITPDGVMSVIGGNLGGAPINIPASRIYDNPVISDRGGLKSFRLTAYDFFYSSLANNHNPTESHTYFIVDTMQGGPVTEVTKSGTSVQMQDEDWALYVTDDILVENNSGDRMVNISSYAIPGHNSSIYDVVYDTQNIAQNLLQYYERRLVWSGKILWNTATDEGRLGTLVNVKDQSGNEFIGNVISSTLNFSGGSISAEIQVLKVPEQS